MCSVANRSGKKPSPGFAGWLYLLAVLELAWLGWFLAAPLPNVGNIGGRVRRWILLSRALPEVVPGVRFDQSHLGLALAELSHVEHLPQRVPVVLGAALIAGAGVAQGRLLLRGLDAIRPPPAPPLGSGPGGGS